MKPRHKRLAMIAAGLVALATAAGFVLYAFERNIVFFFTPSQVAAKEAPVGRAFRIGGLVEPGSVKRDPDGVTVRFVVTDSVKQVAVVYKGPLPDLFREGKGVVTQGRLEDNGIFRADEVLAKHDENYMPPEAQHALDQAHKAGKTLVK